MDDQSKEFSKNLSSQWVESVDIVQNAACDHPCLSQKNLDVDIVRQVLLKKNNSAAGHNGIPEIFYRRLAYALGIPSCIFFQYSIFQHSIPNMWMLGIFTPLYRGKGDRWQFHADRPKSLTDVACKLLGKRSVMQITSYLVKNNLI